MLRAPSNRVRLLSDIEKNNTPSEIKSPEFTGAEISLMRLTSLSRVSTHTSSSTSSAAEGELTSPLNSPASSPRRDATSAELCRLQSLQCELQKALSDAIDKKGWREQELKSAHHSFHTSYATLLINRLLLPRLGLSLSVADDKSDASPANLILLPEAMDLQRQDTSYDERGPCRSKTIDPAEARAIKIMLLNKLSKQQSIKRLIRASIEEINDLRKHLEDIETKMTSEIARIAAGNTVASAPNYYSFYQGSEITPLKLDEPDNKRQRTNGLAK